MRPAAGADAAPGIPAEYHSECIIPAASMVPVTLRKACGRLKPATMPLTVVIAIYASVRMIATPFAAPTVVTRFSAVFAVPTT